MEELSMETRAGIALELIDRLYDTPARKIREGVANAIDAGASRVNITITPSSDVVVIEDNGRGMTLHTFRTEFLHIGGSEKRGSGQIGRIGIGALATFFGDEIMITSRTPEGEGFTAQLHVSVLRNEENRRKPLKDLILGAGVELAPVRGESFTRIEIRQLRPEFIRYFSGEGFVNFQWDLERILPLRYSPDSQLFSRLMDVPGGKEVGEYLLSDRHRTVQVTLNQRPLVRRCFGDRPKEVIREIVAFPGLEIDGVHVWGYAIGAESKLPAQWHGLVTRVKNVAVEETGYLYMSKGYPVEREKVTGELHVEGLDDNVAVNIDRTKFNATNDQVIAVSQLLDKKLYPFLRAVYQRSKQEAQERRRTREHDRILKELTVQNLPDNVDMALSLMAEKLLPTASTLPAGDPIKRIEPVLSFLGYNRADLKWHRSPEGPDVVVYSEPDHPALILNVANSSQDWQTEQRQLFGDMDKVGTAIGVLSDGLRWQVWAGRGPEKRPVAQVSMDRPNEQALAAMQVISKRARWAQDRVERPLAVQTGTPSLFGYILQVSDPRSLSHVVPEFAQAVESFGFEVYDWEEELGESPLTQAWLPAATDPRARIRLIVTDATTAVLLSPNRPVLTYWKNIICRRGSARSYPLSRAIMNYLRNLPHDSYLKIMGFSEDKGQDGVLTRVFREPHSANAVALPHDLLSLWFQTGTLPSLTVFSNDSFALPASENTVLEGHIEELLGMAFGGTDLAN